MSPLPIINLVLPLQKLVAASKVSKWLLCNLVLKPYSSDVNVASQCSFGISSFYYIDL